MDVNCFQLSFTPIQTPISMTLPWVVVKVMTLCLKMIWLGLHQHQGWLKDPLGPQDLPDHRDPEDTQETVVDEGTEDPWALKAREVICYVIK